jgi:hypothetical protein
VAELAYAVTPTLVLAALALGVLGAAYVGALTGLNTSVQLHAPLSERSRILALYTLSLSIFYPLGALVQAAMAKVWGVRPVTFFAACALGVVLVAVALFRPQFWREIGVTPVGDAQILAD